MLALSTQPKLKLKVGLNSITQYQNRKMNNARMVVALPHLPLLSRLQHFSGRQVRDAFSEIREGQAIHWCGSQKRDLPYEGNERFTNLPLAMIDTLTKEERRVRIGCEVQNMLQHAPNHSAAKTEGQTNAIGTELRLRLDIKNP